MRKGSRLRDARSILYYRRKHGEWVRWLEKPEDQRKGAAPVPYFRDCYNCPNTDGLDEEERRAVCNPCTLAESCPIEGFPVGPPAEFLRDEHLSHLPDGALTAYTLDGSLNMTQIEDITAIKESRVGF